MIRDKSNYPKSQYEHFCFDNWERGEGGYPHLHDKKGLSENQDSFKYTGRSKLVLDQKLAVKICLLRLSVTLCGLWGLAGNDNGRSIRNFCHWFGWCPDPLELERCATGFQAPRAQKLHTNLSRLMSLQYLVVGYQKGIMASLLSPKSFQYLHDFAAAGLLILDIMEISCFHIAKATKR